MDRDERKTRNRMKTNKLKQEKYLESKLGQEQETKFRKTPWTREDTFTSYIYRTIFDKRRVSRVRVGSNLGDKTQKLELE